MRVCCPACGQLTEMDRFSKPGLELFQQVNAMIEHRGTNDEQKKTNELLTKLLTQVMYCHAELEIIRMRTRE